MLLILSVTSSGLNFIFQILMGNMLTVGEFGTINSLTSVSANIGILFSPLAILLCSYAVEYVKEKNRQKLSSVLFEVLLFIFLLGLGAILAYNCVRSSFVNVAADSSIGLWNIVVVSTIFGSTFSALLGVFQGLQKFLIYGLFGVIQNMIKIPLSMIGALTSVPVRGVLLAILFSNLLCVTLQLGILCKDQLLVLNRVSLQNFVSLKELGCCYGNTFLVQLFGSFFFNGGDIILAKYAFSEEAAGIFTSALLFGKIPMYIVSVFAVMLLPKATLLQKEKRDSCGLMARVTVISFIITVAMCMGIYLLGPQIIVLLFGEKYRYVYALIGPVCVYVVPMILNYVLMYYLIAINYTKAYIVMLAVVLVIGITGTVTFAKNTEQMLYLFTILLWGTFVINNLLAFKKVHREIR